MVLDEQTTRPRKILRWLAWTPIVLLTLFTLGIFVSGLWGLGFSLFGGS